MTVLVYPRVSQCRVGNEDGLLESLALSQLWEGPQDPVSLTVAGWLGYLRVRCVGSVKCGDGMD